MIRKLLKLAGFLLIAIAVYQAAPVSWHYYKFNWQTGEGEPGYEADRVPSHAEKV